MIKNFSIIVVVVLLFTACKKKTTTITKNKTMEKFDIEKFNKNQESGVWGFVDHNGNKVIEIDDESTDVISVIRITGKMGEKEIIMKTIYKLILYSILILIISTIGITYWYISDHLEYNALDYKFYKVSDIQIQSLIDIIMQIGFVGGILPMFLFLIINFLKIKIKNIWLFSFLIIILIAFSLIIIYRFILYTIFHEFNNPIIFK